ncbi:signal peptidase I [Pseudoteredinibacter isoporae]|uniref:Signal peptidase I n=1 Tax=Pseudoteredinibacter isoporae TaxID=570281 RepID=A0A7X0MZZ6_9GAMM|nr:signal peptidase I [Pseudoteredinibacter isoporae]MBB6523712.1 signal peptidase I [Pseudoteredinibacter isoporae]NHO89215.1 signal peptidase I [Pseudoteredinibacter isoporae]NIB22174.1 signal peptidase I [Pseudoteredinibacter isoporae]
MDINFPLVLVLAVAISGAIWLFDALMLAPGRRRNLAEVKANQEGSTALSDEQKTELEAVAEREPVVVEYAKSFFPVLAIVLVLRSFIAEPFQIPSPSMVPTLKIGDFILVNKYTYGLRLPVIRTKVLDVNDPKRGDVMVFFPPHKPDTYYIKRVVGLPGDHIRYTNNVLYVNGEKMPQTVLASLPPAQPQYQLVKEKLGDVEHDMRKKINPGHLSRHGEWVVPADHYFMMGDNRDNSSDSRVWGPVHESAIVGKAFAIWMTWESLLSLPSFERVGGIQ